MQNSSSYYYGSTWASDAARREAVARATARAHEARQREEQFLLTGTLAASIARAYRARMVELTGR